MLSSAVRRGSSAFENNSTGPSGSDLEQYAASAARIIDASPNPAHLRSLPGRTRQIIPCENPSTHISQLDGARVKKKTYVLRERMSLDGSAKIVGVEEEDFIYMKRKRCFNFEKMCAMFSISMYILASDLF